MHGIRCGKDDKNVFINVNILGIKKQDVEKWIIGEFIHLFFPLCILFLYKK